MFRYLGALILAIAIPFTLHAQTAADLSLSIVPTNPDPGSLVTVQVQSYGVDLNQATLTWKYNGRTAGSGVGKTNISVIAPQAGSIATVTVNVSGVGLDASSASIAIQPASLDIVWEAADAYHPPFYKGKTLLPIGGVVRVAAIPSMNAPKTVSYVWSRNGSALPTLSGYGKSSILFKNDILKNKESVEVAATGGFFSGGNSISITPTDPRLVIYQNKEGFIEYAKGSTDTVSLTGTGAVLHFEPYFFSLPSNSLSKDLAIALSENNNPIPSNGAELRLSRPENGGTSQFKAIISTVAYSLQHVEKSFTVSFN